MSKRSISQNNKGFKKICLVSSAAFSAASCVWPWTAPIGAGLGLYASIDSEERVELEFEFTDAVAVALRKTEENLTTVDSKEIIKEARNPGISRVYTHKECFVNLRGSNSTV